jgi:hypothetical protein
VCCSRWRLGDRVVSICSIKSVPEDLERCLGITVKEVPKRKIISSVTLTDVEAFQHHGESNTFLCRAGLDVLF